MPTRCVLRSCCCRRQGQLVRGQDDSIRDFDAECGSKGASISAKPAPLRPLTHRVIAARAAAPVRRFSAQPPPHPPPQRRRAPSRHTQRRPLTDSLNECAPRTRRGGGHEQAAWGWAYSLARPGTGGRRASALRARRGAAGTAWHAPALQAAAGARVHAGRGGGSTRWVVLRCGQRATPGGRVGGQGVWQWGRDARAPAHVAAPRRASGGLALMRRGQRYRRGGGGSAWARPAGQGACGGGVQRARTGDAAPRVTAGRATPPGCPRPAARRAAAPRRPLRAARRSRGGRCPPRGG